MNKIFQYNEITLNIPFSISLIEFIIILIKKEKVKENIIYPLSFSLSSLAGTPPPNQNIRFYELEEFHRCYEPLFLVTNQNI